MAALQSAAILFDATSLNRINIFQEGKMNHVELAVSEKSGYGKLDIFIGIKLFQF